MSCSPCRASAQDPIFFDAVLTPHRSLGPKGFLILMTAIGALSFTAGLAFFLAGAWPVVGFLGLDVALIYLAFRINYRHANQHERLVLTRERLLIEKVDPWGRGKEVAFQPTWLQVLIDDPPGHESQLRLRSHGKSVAVGGFLTPEERLELAEALRGALDRARRPV